MYIVAIDDGIIVTARAFSFTMRNDMVSQQGQLSEAGDLSNEKDSQSLLQMTVDNHKATGQSAERGHGHQFGQVFSLLVAMIKYITIIYYYLVDA